MSSQTVFLRLLHANDKAAALVQVVADTNADSPNPLVFFANPQAFRQVPGSPFAYWLNEHVRDTYRKFELLETQSRTARSGPYSGDDFRRIRMWWEPSSGVVAHGREWATFAKGGGQYPYYADTHLLVAWDYTRNTFLDFYGRPGRMIERPESVDYFFLAGITWPARTNGFSVRVLPAGSVFGHKGPSIHVTGNKSDELVILLALMNSTTFLYLVKAQLARYELAQSYEVGLIQNVPVPQITDADGSLQLCAVASYDMRRRLDGASEISHVFHLPTILHVSGDTLTTCVHAWIQHVSEIKTRLDANQQEINRITLELYGLTEEDIRLPEENVTQQIVDASANDDTSVLDEVDSSDTDDEMEETPLELDLAAHADALISYLVGCAFGRWDIRFATGEKPMPQLGDPFDPLPACSPGMLTGDDGLPLLKAPPGYPMRIDADGILVDDADHADDIVRRVREALDVIFGARAEVWERDLCAALEVSDLRDYFRKGAFWQAHIKRYSKSRRKAPIYWHLQSPKKHYAIWLYYHRLDRDTLLKALVKYAEPKVRREQSKLDELLAKRSAMATLKEQRTLDRDVERQQAVVNDVRKFCERLERAAKLYLVPDLNDGVVLTIAPLREVAPWKEAARYWSELRAGKYEWSSVGKQMREKGLVN